MGQGTEDLRDGAEFHLVVFTGQILSDVAGSWSVRLKSSHYAR